MLVDLLLAVFFLIRLRPPRSTRSDTLCPSSTLFRSIPPVGATASAAAAASATGTTDASSAVTRPVTQAAAAPSSGAAGAPASAASRSEEHTSELQPLMRISYADLCFKKKYHRTPFPTSTQPPMYRSQEHTSALQ